MKHLWFVFLALSLPWATPLSALELLSVAPTEVYPGDTVRLSGGPFPPDVLVRIGREVLDAVPVTEQELTLTVPSVPEGDYLLSLLHQGVASPSSFTLRIRTKPPTIINLTPSVVDECLLQENARIEVEGEGFPRGSSILVDGNPAPSQWESAGSIILLLPPLTSGTHQLQVIAPGERRSLPRAFLVNNRPEIHSAYPGEDRVNSYEVIIRGKNFLSRSTLLVDGTVIPASAALPSQTGRLRHVDCETLIYTRYPYSRTPKTVILQVVNPGGVQSDPFSLSIP